jgi:hypothetical protein
MILLKNGLIVAAVSIPRIVDTRKLPSRYGKRGYILVRLAFFSRSSIGLLPHGQIARSRARLVSALLRALE